MTEETVNEEKVHVEEETSGPKENGRKWTEEITVAAGELMEVVKKLVHETTVRRIVIKNEAKHVHLEIPLAIGVVGIWLLPFYAAIGVIAALVTDCTILVERAEKQPEATE